MKSVSTHLGYLGAAIKVLEDAGEPLHYREITKRALDQGWIVTQGQTPWATMSARIGSAVKHKGESSRFVRVAPGVFGLRSWLAGC